jgi:hypothetical protein
VLLVTHQFSDRIRFVSEIELEHAFVEGQEDAGELELEQAYLDFLVSRPLNFRAGMLLMPMGIINERHEPPVFYGVERPIVDTVIIPTTWFEVGAGIHGEVGRGWRYRAYVTSPLDAAEFTAAEGIRDGRQRGSETRIARAAFTGRLEYVGVRGFTAGAAVWSGISASPFRLLFNVPVTVSEADARYQRGRVEARAQFAYVSIGNAGLLNDATARTSGIDPNVASGLRGIYAEGAYRLVEGGTRGDVAAFVRYENADTQYRMPTGALPLQQFKRDAWVFGATYWPDPDIAVKADYIHHQSESSIVGPFNSFNLGLGWWF